MIPVNSMSLKRLFFFFSFRFFRQCFCAVQFNDTFLTFFDYLLATLFCLCSLQYFEVPTVRDVFASLTVVFLIYYSSVTVNFVDATIRLDSSQTTSSLVSTIVHLFICDKSNTTRFSSVIFLLKCCRGRNQTADRSITAHHFAKVLFNHFSKVDSNSSPIFSPYHPFCQIIFWKVAWNS